MIHEHEYMESNLSRSLPSRMILGPFKILEWKWFNGRYPVGMVLVFDLIEKRMKGFVGTPTSLHEYDISSEENEVKEIADYGCRLSTEETIVVFKNYFLRDEVYKNLEKDFKLFLSITEILDEK